MQRTTLDSTPTLRFATVAAALLALAPGCVTNEALDPTGTIAEGITVCPGGSQVEGIDVSVYQGGSVNWGAIAASGRKFGIARIGDGTGTDSTFAHNWAGMRAAGMIRGGYQFFEPGEDPMAQARVAIAAVGGRLGAGDLPVMCDVEVTGGQSPGTIAAHLQTWLNAVAAGTGKTPYIYTGGWFWNPRVASSAFGHYGLADSWYSTSCPNLPTGWNTYRIWQYTDGTCAGCPSVGSVPSIGQSCDRDRFNGSLAELQAWANGDGAAAWGAQFVSQSFPYASDGAVTLHPNAATTISITLKNVGTHAWDAHTCIGTTGPRDRTSPLAGPEWQGPNRPACVPAGMTVAAGANHTFTFQVHGPATPGRFDEHWGVLEDGTAWFSDPGNAGPPDDDLEGIFTNVEGGPDDGATGDAAADGGELTGEVDDGGPRDASVGPRDGGAGALDGGTDTMPGGCGCSVPGGTTRSLGAPGVLLAFAALGSLRARRRRTG